MISSAAGAWLALALALLALWWFWPRAMAWTRAELTGKWYYVRNMPGRQAVADRLAAMEVKINEFLDDADARAPGDPRLQNIRDRWNGTLAETPDRKDIAYAVAKDSIHVCIRAKHDPQALESVNTCMFVLLHELAHVATDGYGHMPRFWANMRFLLELAEATGHYRYEEFERTRTTYCGRRLGSSPLTCIKRGTCRSELRRN